MKKILFDASVHLGQFCLSSEGVRVACKNSQVSISTKPDNKTIGLITFNENSWADHVIWELERDAQDVFYKFMDVFHTVKNIERISLSFVDTKLAMDFSEKFKLDISNALTCAVAISQNANIIHTYYHSLLATEVKKFLKGIYSVEISSPATKEELKYSEKDLEKFYQDALTVFRRNKINLLDHLHK